MLLEASKLRAVWKPRTRASVYVKCAAKACAALALAAADVLVTSVRKSAATAAIAACAASHVTLGTRS